MFHIHELYISIRSAIYVFYSENGGGAVNLVFGSLSSSIMALFVFYSDEWIFIRRTGVYAPRFLLCLLRRRNLWLKLPLMVVASVNPVPGGWVTSRLTDILFIFLVGVFDCDINNRCEECLEWSEDDIIKYAKYRKSLKSRESSSRAKTSVSTPPLTPSGHSPQTAPQPAPRPAQRDDIQSQVD